MIPITSINEDQLASIFYEYGKRPGLSYSPWSQVTHDKGKYFTAAKTVIDYLKTLDNKIEIKNNTSEDIALSGNSLVGEYETQDTLHEPAKKPVKRKNAEISFEIK